MSAVLRQELTYSTVVGEISISTCSSTFPVGKLSSGRCWQSEMNLTTCQSMISLSENARSLRSFLTPRRNTCRASFGWRQDLKKQNSFCWRELILALQFSSSGLATKQ